MRRSMWVVVSGAVFLLATYEAARTNGWQVIPFTLGGSVVGQIVGGIVSRRRA